MTLTMTIDQKELEAIVLEHLRSEHPTLEAAGFAWSTTPREYNQGTEIALSVRFTKGRPAPPPHTGFRK